MLGRDNLVEETVIIVRGVKALLSHYVLNWGLRRYGDGAWLFNACESNDSPWLGIRLGLAV